MVDCRWADETTTAIIGAYIPLGRKYALDYGLMEITYDTGAKVIVQGPASFEVESTNGGFLSIGKLTGKVSVEKAKGFSVRTPTATITDLGTEFGVEVDGKGVTDAQVFVGEVQVAAASDRPGGNKQPLVVRAGQNAHVAKGVTLSVDQRDFDARAKRFTRTMPSRSPTSDAYAKLVLSMNPVVYYRMDQWPATDRKGRYVIVDSAPGGYHGVACLDEAFGKPSCRGKFGGAMDFQGSMGNNYAVVKDYPKTDNGQLSVSAWVWTCLLDPWSSIVSNWFFNPTPGQVHTIGQFGIGTNASRELNVAIHQDDGTEVRVREPGKPLPYSQWQHVAFVADGAVLHLYRNGKKVGATPYRGIARSPLLDHLSIGIQMNRNGTRPRPQRAFVWNGRLDEVAVFNHALSAEQVYQLYAGQAAAANRRTSP
jgi:hypothetical protein